MIVFQRLNAVALGDKKSSVSITSCTSISNAFILTDAISSNLFIFFFHMEGKFAFLTEITWFLEKNNEDCELLKIKSDFAPISYGMALPKGSPMTKFFSER